MKNSRGFRESSTPRAATLRVSKGRVTNRLREIFARKISVSRTGRERRIHRVLPSREMDTPVVQVMPHMRVQMAQKMGMRSEVETFISRREESTPLPLTANRMVSTVSRSMPTAVFIT